MILGLAGHVDHGKTALVKWLTGVDTDRLPEEKKRGITLELGFAQLTLPDKRTLSVIDMPGHERFVNAMAAGTGGIDLVILVIAADEGVMPQTREHLDICTLLGVQAGLVVITKSDLLAGLGAEWKALLETDIRALTVDTFLKNAGPVEVSAKTGEGHAVLLEQIAATVNGLQSTRSEDGPFFMPIDRAFTIKGFGCVVTGTVRSGQLAVGDEVNLLPGPSSPKVFRIRGLQSHSEPVERVLVGQRAAVNLVGIETTQVHRGMVLTRANELHATQVLDVELALLPSCERPLPRRSRQLLTVGTAQVEAVVVLLEIDALQPGKTGFAQLRLAKPIAALPGQRFIVRGTRVIAGRGATLGGGQILALDGKRHRRGQPVRLSELATGDLETRVTWLLTDAGHAGLTETELFTRASSSQKELSRALELAASRGRVVLIERDKRRWLATAVFEAIRARAVGRLEVFHAAVPEREGMVKEELRQRLGELDERLFARVLTTLLESRRVETTGDCVRLPGRGRTVDEATQQLRQRLIEAFAAAQLAPPTLELVASRVGLELPKATPLVRALVASGHLVKAGEQYFDAGAVAALESRVRAFFEHAQQLSTQQFKELVGQSRKFAMPLAEYFDARGVTLRVGDVRVLRVTSVAR